MLKNILVGCAVLLTLVACNEDDGEGADDQTGSSATSQTEETAADTEDTSSADDGGGALDGASDSEAAEESASANTSSEVSQDAIDGCIDNLRSAEGATGGTVTSTEFSEANSLVMLEDATGNLWRCLVSNDGSNPSLEQVGGNEGGEDTATADDGGGAMDGASSETNTPSVGSPTDLTEFEGARAGQAEGGIQALGFESIRSEGLTTFWFNRDTGACASITTSDGVYSEITMLPAEDC